ncbi:uncharacterized protein LOC111059988 isoform X2 [Nilaparvata lugens]|uniref:uncharacterized protein LOC111059988 isoform X2 n=1 Tax=Nilaparvata lugens TaxID=108931 RepID=UPI00193CB371|nr:uncharacterized protein LOC111059988 isoform X2 [Nilaparvata lugens]
MSVFVPYVIMEFFGSMTSRYDFVTLTEKLSVNITLLESAVKFIYCYMRRRQLADLLGVFEENFLLCMQQNRATNLKILENYAKNLTGNINLFIIIIYATVGLWNSLPILSCFQESSCVTLQIMPSWYPISIDQAPIKQLVYLLEFVIMCYCASLLYSVNCLILAFARMISSQVEILKLSMTSLAQNAAKTVYSQNANNSVYSQNAANSVYAQNAAKTVPGNKNDHDFEVSEIYGNKDDHNLEVSEIYGSMDNHTLMNGDLLRSDYHIEESEILYRRYQKRVDDLQRDCLIDYQRILSQAALMEQTFSPLILFQLAVSTITLCLVLISLTTKTAANSTISLTLGCKFSMYLIFGLMELFVYSGVDILYRIRRAACMEVSMRWLGFQILQNSRKMCCKP